MKTKCCGWCHPIHWNLAPKNPNHTTKKAMKYFFSYFCLKLPTEEKVLNTHKKVFIKIAVVNH